MIILVPIDVREAGSRALDEQRSGGLQLCILRAADVAALQDDLRSAFLQSLKLEGQDGAGLGSLRTGKCRNDGVLLAGVDLQAELRACGPGLSCLCADELQALAVVGKGQLSVCHDALCLRVHGDADLIAADHMLGCDLKREERALDRSDAGQTQAEHQGDCQQQRKEPANVTSHNLCSSFFLMHPSRVRGPAVPAESAVLQRQAAIFAALTQCYHKHRKIASIYF